MKVYYHGTSPQNYASIVCNGINASWDGFVYLADSVENAARFAAFKSDNTSDFDVIVFAVKVRKKDESKIFESADHNERFWGCKAFVYDGSIPKEMVGACHKVHFTAKAGE